MAKGKKMPPKGKKGVNPFAKMPPGAVKPAGPNKKAGKVEATCPDCGGKMKNGVCPDCGYMAK